MDPTPFLRGNPWPPTSRVPFPRAKPGDGRIPSDTWRMASIPAGVRLELDGEAAAIEIAYETATDQLFHPGAGSTFSLWRGDERVAEARADGDPVQLAFGVGRATVHIPEGKCPRILSVDALDGTIAPAPPGPRWICYGDSIAEGWCVSEPGCAWPSRLCRTLGLDLQNLGYAGAARAEIATAEQIAELGADVISIAYGTNCWMRTPHSVGMVREGFWAFCDVLRQGHPDTPILVVSPVLRPDAEDTPNRLGATLADIRAVIEEGAERLGLPLVRGLPIVEADMLTDGIHPGDKGHARIADAVGSRLCELVG